MKTNIGSKMKFLGLIFLSSIILSACSNPFDSLADEINGLFSGGGTSESGSGGNGENDAEASLFNYELLNGQGTETTLEEGEYEVGKDIPEGRYRVTSSEGRGNFSVTSESEKRQNFVNAVVSDDESDESAVDEIITYLFDGHEITIYSTSLSFTPFEGTVPLDALPPGQYIVGEDIEPGTYEISADTEESYLSFDVYNGSHQERKMRLQLGDPSYGGAKTHMTLLEAGDIVVTDAPEIKLSLQN